VESCLTLRDALTKNPEAIFAPHLNPSGDPRERGLLRPVKDLPTDACTRLQQAALYARRSDALPALMEIAEVSGRTHNSPCLSCLGHTYD